MKILVASDGSKNADEALKSLKNSGLADLEVEALVVSVEESWMPEPPPSSYELVGLASAPKVSRDLSLESDDFETGASCQAAKKAARWLRETFPKWKVRAESLYGLAAQEVIKRAKEWKPDLIVVGALGHSAIHRLVLGSVSQSVVRQNLCSVHIGRLTDSGRLNERILIGFDGSAGAEAAVQKIAERKWSPSSEVRLMFVDESGTAETAGLLSDEEVIKYDENGNLAALRLKLTESVKLLESKGLIVSTVFKTGKPAESLIAEAEAWDADSIFVGARGLNLLKRMLLGSISSAVAAQAHCSVEIVH